MAKTPSTRRKAGPKVETPEHDSIVEDAEFVTLDPQEQVIEPKTEMESVADPAVETVEQPPQDRIPEPTPAVPRRGPGFIPLVLGGAIAAGLGFAAAWVYLPKDDGAAALAMAEQAQSLAAQLTMIDELKADVAALQSMPGPESALADLDSTLSARLQTAANEQTAATKALETRLGAVERAPNADGSLPQTAIDAFNSDIATLRSEVAAQAAEMQRLADAASAQLEQVRASAAQIEQGAAEAALQSAQRVALARVQAALESGAPYDLDLPDLTVALGADLSAALTGPSETGVPTLLALQEAYPEAARAALATARAEGVSGEDDSTVTGFLRTMFDVRSVEPRNGTTTDAILSRAEAALQDGRVADTVAEITSLPEVVRTDFSDWLALAQTRLDALAAVGTLSLSLSEN